MKTATIMAVLAALLIAGPARAETPQVAPKLYYEKALKWHSQGQRKAAILLMKDLVREYPESPEAARAKAWLDRHRELDRSGRTEFIIGATTIGTYFGYTLSFGMAGDDLSPNEGKIALWSSVGGGVVGLAGSVIASQYIAVSDAQALLFNFSGSWGWLNGFLVYDLVSPLDIDDSLKAGAGGMAAGVLASALLWEHLDVKEGAAQFAVTSTIFSLETLVLTNLLIGGQDVFRDNETVALLSLLVPSNAVLVGSYYLGRRLDWSAGDVRLIGLGGFLGNLVGGALLATLEIRNFRGAVGLLMGSSLAGLGLGTVLVAPWEGAGSSKTASLGSGLVNYRPGGDWSVGAPAPMYLGQDRIGDPIIGANLLDVVW